MEHKEVSVLIGGRAGEGISSAGQVIAQMLGHQGYRVHMYYDYPSLIKGGHNFAIIRGADQKIGAVRNTVDFLLALNQETVDLHREKLTSEGVLVFRSDAANAEGVAVPVKRLLEEEGAPAVMGNSAILGAFVRAAGMDWEVAETVLRKAIPKQIDTNLRIARRAYDEAEVKTRISPLGAKALPVVTGNEAIGLGLIQSGLGLYCGYPMSPTSNLLHFLVSHGTELRIRVIQPESETAAILMALGCAYAGIRAAVGTSGGGFCLMVEALSLAGIAELPVLVVLGQRTGPSTGLATYTAQADLQFALGAGQADFPRLITAPGDADELMAWAAACLDLTWKYQLPAILLSDKTLCEGMYSLDTSQMRHLQIDLELADKNVSPYTRYSLTESGISPLRFPPASGEIIRVNSHVHDPDGITTENEETTKAMADKRMRKMRGLAEEIEAMDPVHLGGDVDASTALLCWGSNKGICEELGTKMGLRVIQPVVLWPFPERSFARVCKGVERMFTVECNESGQLARLVRQFGYASEDVILKYNGRPFFVDELEALLGRAIS
ncbi:MAG: 2-oxoacid:acceptor oxidoreductase subunit alpha [Methanomicrobiales archaeon]|nr:2-oxoacid:acceptor oxidoreductase subunit alpha [Methanomicrobiales archaeon]